MTEEAHPLSYEQLVAFACDELAADEAALVVAHLTACAHCRASLRRLHLLLGAVGSTPVEVPPAASVARANAIFSPPVKAPALRWRLAAAMGVLAMLLSVVSAQQVAAAAQAALPGDQLYPVKGIVAELQLVVTINAVERAELHLQIVNEKTQEFTDLVALGRYEHIRPSVERYQTEIDAAVVALRIAARNDQALGLHLMHQAMADLTRSADQLTRLGQAGPETAEPLLQEAVDVAEAGQALLRAQLSQEALNELAALAATAEPPAPVPTHTVTIKPPPSAAPPPSATRRPTAAATQEPATPVPSVTRRPTATATQEPTTPVPSATATATPSPSSTPVASATSMPTPTASASATLTPEATATDIFPPSTDTPEATHTPEATGTPEATDTPPATETPQATDTPEPTDTPPTTDTPEPTGTPEPTATATSTATVSITPTQTPPATVTPTPTPTTEPVETLLPDGTPMPTVQP